MEIVKDIDMTIKPEEQAKPITPQLVMGLVPCLNERFLNIAWTLIKSYVEELSSKTNGEYGIYDIWQNLWNGKCSLHLAYMNNSGKVTPENTGNMFVEHLANPKKDFVGYVITRLDPQSVHVWQVVIMPEYQNTNAFKVGYQYIENYLRNIGAPYITFSTQREGWHKTCLELGFTETYTVYRKALKE